MRTLIETKIQDLRNWLSRYRVMKKQIDDLAYVLSEKELNSFNIKANEVLHEILTFVDWTETIDLTIKDRLLLRMKYCTTMTNKDIADKMHYEERYIKQLNKDCLYKIVNVLEVNNHDSQKRNS